MKIEELSDEQRAILIALELEIFKCGVYGGLSTSEAIENLFSKEKEFGVFDENAKRPRYLN